MCIEDVSKCCESCLEYMVEQHLWKQSRDSYVTVYPRSSMRLSRLKAIEKSLYELYRSFMVTLVVLDH